MILTKTRIKKLGAKARKNWTCGQGRSTDESVQVDLRLTTKFQLYAPSILCLTAHGRLLDSGGRVNCSQSD